MLNKFLIALAVACPLLGATTLEAGRVPWKIKPKTARKHVNPIKAKELPEALIAGARHYKKYCMGCHGAAGRPDPKSGAVQRMRYIPRVTEKALKGQSDGELFVKITLGRRPMMGYRRHLRDRQRWELVSFLRTLGTPPPQVESVLQRRMQSIQYCFEKRNNHNSTKAGNIEIEFTIGKSGRVEEAAMLNTKNGAAAVGSCIASRVKKWRFPRPDNGPITLVYPFHSTSS